MLRICCGYRISAEPGHARTWRQTDAKGSLHGHAIGLAQKPCAAADCVASTLLNPPLLLIAFFCCFIGRIAAWWWWWHFMFLSSEPAPVGLSWQKAFWKSWSTTIVSDSAAVPRLDRLQSCRQTPCCVLRQLHNSLTRQDRRTRSRVSTGHLITSLLSLFFFRCRPTLSRKQNVLDEMCLFQHCTGRPTDCWQHDSNTCRRDGTTACNMHGSMV